jgi:apolipoprotein N-acyltransferase
VARFELSLRSGSTAASALQAAVLGVAHALSFAPWNLWWLQLLAQAGLFALALRAPSARSAAALGFAFGMGWFVTGVSWVYISLHEYGQMWAWLAGLATAAFAAVLAVYPGLALWVAHRFVPEANARLLLALPAAWAGTEWLRGILFTGCPWLAAGYAHSDGPLAAYAPLVGVYGITLIAALLAAALVAAIRYPISARAAVAGAILIAGFLLEGLQLARVAWTQPFGSPINVRLAQGNIPQDQKFGPQSLEKAHEIYFALMSRPGPVDLVALPESVYPLPLSYLPNPVTRDLVDFVRNRKAALVFGIFIEEPERHFYNSAIALAPDRPGAQRYSKRHLVPFGEFIPFGFRWFVDLMQMPIGDQERGMRHQPPFDVAGQRVAVNICYEDLFGAEIIEAWHDPQHTPTMLLNLSNLAWFNDSDALPQHLQISRLRALETGRPMLRATNTGATAIIGPHGEVTAQLAYDTVGVLDGAVQGYTGDTPFIRFGNLPALGAVFVLLLAARWFGRRQ